MNRNSTQNTKIEILPEHIIDQIKAGEVLERPASLVKELIENSLDAGSTEINIHLIENGLELLSIEDNGHGMSFDNLPYAFLRHATSKLKNYEDLYRLKSFGFRGEALASVAASARITCTTQPKDLSLDGGKIIIHGGEQTLLISNKSNTHGTGLFIKDLFYNTPARLKFIKSKVSEKSALKKMLYAFVLSHPETQFSIKWDEKEKEIFKKEESLHRAQQVFYSKINKENSTQIWSASEEYDGYKVEVFFTPTTHSTPQYRHHYLFANDRFFQDKSFHSAVLRTLEPLWRFGESGHYMVKITTPATDLDVNVHPNKTQIKFLKSDVIYSLLVTGLRKALKNHTESFNAQILAGSTEILQSPFFTREENQNLDLRNMSETELQGQNHYPQNSYSNPYRNFTQTHSSQSEQVPASPLLGLISPNIILLKLENSFYIADVKKIIAHFLTASFLEFQEKEEVPSPLLISEPFKISNGKIDTHWEDLKLLGFELDRLNQEVIVLRTIPRFLPQALSRDVTQSLLNYFSVSKVKNFDALDFECFLEINGNFNQEIPEHLILQMIQKSSSSLIKLSEANLKGLLK
jgi:DNA mismatch repair protein MutL